MGQLTALEDICKAVGEHRLATDVDTPHAARVPAAGPKPAARALLNIAPKLLPKNISVTYGGVHQGSRERAGGPGTATARDRDIA